MALNPDREELLARMGINLVLTRVSGIFRASTSFAYPGELRRWQKELNRVTTLDTDPFSDPVELQDVIDAAKRLHKVPDRDWS